MRKKLVGGKGGDMNLRTLLPILVLTTFVLLLVACGGGSQSADTPTPVPATVFNPSLFEVRVEEAVVYGTGGTLDGGQVELLLDLAIPDTGTDGPRPLFVHIHGGDFVEGSRWSQWDVAEKGWVAASIDYRLAGDEPLPGPRVKPFFDAIGGESSSARDRYARYLRSVLRW